jgi:cellulose synthase/poly-beta-1,6-N-acetylglucosamine synthase-like glycosyltransferase
LVSLCAKGEILFFVDADVAVPPDAVGQMSAVFQQNPDLAAVFGSYDDRPFETNFLSQYRNLFHHYVHQTAKEEAATFWRKDKGRILNIKYLAGNM